MERRVAVSLALLGVLLVLVPSPATAAQKTFVDERGDAPARFDIASARIDNSVGQLRVTTRFRALDASGTQIYGFLVTSNDRSESYMLTAVRRPSGRVTTRVTSTLPLDQCTFDTSWSPRKDTIDVRVSGECTVPGAVRVSTFIGAGDGSYGDPADFTREVRARQD
jgi:hypothetical protein